MTTVKLDRFDPSDGRSVVKKKHQNVSCNISHTIDSFCGLSEELFEKLDESIVIQNLCSIFIEREADQREFSKTKDRFFSQKTTDITATIKSVIICTAQKSVVDKVKAMTINSIAKRLFCQEKAFADPVKRIQCVAPTTDIIVWSRLMFHRLWIRR